ncbi:DBH-like monooxygenase protein 1 homolog [Branchiostoma floridae x Branchiostoma japonicum]
MAKACKCSHLLTFTIVFAILARLVNANGFTHHETLDEAGKYNLFWKFDEEKIEFEAHVQTKGWVGLGLSPNGGMPGSDIVIGWVKDGKAHLTDRYADAKAQPAVDESQDWELVSGNENGTHTVLRFSRKLMTCDTKDRVINKDTMRVIWAWHDEDPEEDSGGDGPGYHSSNRGVRSSVLITQAVPETSLPDTTYTFDVIMNNVSIPNYWHTLYWCMLIKLPTMDKKHHIVKMEPVITPGNEGLVHHFLVYKCRRNLTTTLPDDHEGHNCFSPGMPMEWGECFEGDIIAAWVTGTGAITYPEHVGYPIGDDDDTDYLMLQMHYDNPQMLPGLYDSSGLRLIYTPELRENEIGIFEVGMRLGKEHVIPPGADSFTSAAFCDPQCLSQYLEELGQPIKIFADILHSHLLGVQLSLKLIRDGVETDISRDDNYDFNLQYMRQMGEEIAIYPGDTLVMECSYRSTDQDNVVYGGLGALEEMCMDFVFYYPKSKLRSCDSRPSSSRTLGFVGVEDYIPDPFKILAPPSLVNKSYEDVVEGFQWTGQRVQQFSSHILDGNFSTFCLGMGNGSADYYLTPMREMPLPRGTRVPPPDPCSRTASSACRPRLTALHVWVTAFLMLWRQVVHN